MFNPGAEHFEHQPIVSDEENSTADSHTNDIMLTREDGPFAPA